MAAATRDPRRLGIAAAGLCGAYVVALFVPGSVAPLVVGLLSAVAALVFAVVTPLPRWRESDDRKRVAAWAMAGEAVAVAAIVTAVRVFVM